MAFPLISNLYLPKLLVITLELLEGININIYTEAHQRLRGS